MPENRGTILLEVARAAITVRLGRTVVADESASWLATHGATFVTLTQGGQLRGCIGTLESFRPLGEDLKANARAAAFDDPRFPALTLDELQRTRVEVSLLSSQEPLEWSDEADAIAKLRPGIDGVVLAHRGNRGTFLPQVWEQVPDATTFMRHLKRKAGLAPNFWAVDIQLHRYTVEKWKETPAPAQVA
jgi:AmmeMemoRadiSam system protein A